MNEQQVRDMIEEEAFRLGSQKALAEACGISPCAISLILSGDKKPFRSVLRYFGLRRVVTVSYTFKS